MRGHRMNLTHQHHQLAPILRTVFDFRLQRIESRAQVIWIIAMDDLYPAAAGSRLKIVMRTMAGFFHADRLSSIKDYVKYNRSLNEVI